MYLAGITDEAGSAIETQIAVTKALGWKNIELRKVKVGESPDAVIHDLSDADFDRVVEQLEAAALSVCCFSSAIANWGKSVTEPFEPSWEEAQRSIPRMKRLGTRFVRIMSFKVLRDADGHPLPVEQQQFEERARRLRELVALFADHGLQAVHENCMNYGGMGWPMTLQLLEAVPGLKLVFDTGNPVFAQDFSKPEPRPMQDALEFYQKVKSEVVYVHIKDGVWNPETKKTAFCFPGEGEGKVAETLRALFDDGFDGGISIEPHMAKVFHDTAANEEDAAAKCFEVFVEYGRRLENLIEEVRGRQPALA